LSFRIFNLHVRLSLVLLALLEATVLLLAPHLVTWFGLGSFGEQLGTSSQPVRAGAIVFASFGLLSLLAVGLYSTRQRANLTGIAVRVVTAIAGAVVLSALVYYFLPDIGIGRRTLAMSAGIAVVGCLAVRVALERLLDEELFRRRVLVIGSGHVTHNLRDWMASRDALQPLPYVTAFADWLARTLAQDDEEALLAYRERAPGAVQAHPTEEHFLPLYIALGAAGPHAAAHRSYAGLEGAALSMDAYEFRQAA